MKLLSLSLSSLILVACGGGTAPVASPPAPFIMASVPVATRKATTVTGGNAVVIHMYQALYGMAPSNALVLDYAFQANNDASTFVRNLTDRFATTSHADLAKLVLDNLGVTPTSVPAINAKGESEYALLLDAVRQIFGAFPTMRGQVILNMTNLLTGLENDATYGAAASTYTAQTSANFSYSSRSASEISAVVKPPSPTVTLALSQSSAKVGSIVTLSWSSTGATSCTGSESWSGTQPKSGSASIAQSIGGRYEYILTCMGIGGTDSKSVFLTVPMKVFGTSYENKNNIVLDDPRLPHLSDIPGVIKETGEQDIGERAVAFADFMQEGGFSAITTTTFYRNVFPGSNPGKWPDSPAKLYLLRKNTTGTWIDVTSQLIKTNGERYMCVSPGFIEVADLNNDGKPDAAISCTGPDFTINGVFDDKSVQYVVLSQPDGSYKVVELGIAPIYAHQVALVDIDGDGNVDILSVDPGHFFTPIVLWGKGDGTFRVDSSRFPSDMYQKAIYGIRAIPVNGKINILVSGNPVGAQAGGSSPSDYGTKVLQYTNGAFQYVTDFSNAIPKVASTGLVYGLALDAIYKDGAYYFLRVNGDYTGSSIVRTNAITGTSTLLTEVVRGNNSDTSGILKLDSRNNFISQMGDCGPNSLIATDYFHYQCTFAIPLQ
ncbi:MAG: FG-GAP repeat domain-containing protein [Candidatus Methylumidiphilus sp.]